MHAKFELENPEHADVTELQKPLLLRSAAVTIALK
jgi:hypothetical protein